jgi:hypothetical protein
MRAERWSTTPCALDPQVNHVPRRRVSDGRVPPIGADARWLRGDMLVAGPGVGGLVGRAD